MCPDVSGEVVGPAEGAEADPALERFLAGVDADVPGELVTPREPTVALAHRAGVRPLMYRRLQQKITLKNLYMMKNVTLLLCMFVA